MKKTGVYIHIPFCKSKCPYCDFYSIVNGANFEKEYFFALKKEISCAQDLYADTIYIGGGTPSAVSPDRLAEIISFAKQKFHFDCGEITVEANPSSLTLDFAQKLARAGVNRFSLGVQSVNDNERKILGRKSDKKTIEEKIKMLHSLGINNISLDIMLAIAEQTITSLKNTLEFCVDSGAKHISAYILKIEDGTFFAKNKEKYNFPDEDECAEMYEFCCEFLEKHGFLQYEISNFALNGFESRHNLKYWNCEDYIGFGAAAHSFLDGKRFFHKSSLREYISSPLDVVPDGDGGNFSEYAMLCLRLSKGLKQNDVIKRFGHEIPGEMISRANPFLKEGFVFADDNGIYLTKKGFLISNYIISNLLDF